MNTLVRSTLAGTSKELPGQPQKEGRSAEGVLAQVLFTPGSAAREKALQQVQEILSEIKQETPSVTAEAEVTSTDSRPVYRSAYVPERPTVQPQLAAVIKTPQPRKVFGIFTLKSQAQIYKERQAQKAA